MRRHLPLVGLWVALLLGVAPSHAAAVDIVIVVSAENPDMQLSPAQVADLFLGRAHRFPDGRRAVPIDRGEGTPLREAFHEHFIRRSPAQFKAHWSKLIFTGRGRPPPQIADDDDVRRRVAGDPSAISYLDRSAVDASVRIVGLP